MSTRDAETLADLVNAKAGKGAKLTFVQLSERSVDPETGYQPSANLLWKIASGQDVKVNRQLVRAVAAGLELDLQRVRDAAARQYLGWEAVDPFDTDPGDDDVVVRVARAVGARPEDMPAVREFVTRVKGETGGDTGGNG